MEKSPACRSALRRIRPRSALQDVVIIAVKATALADVAARIAPLLREDTIVVPAMNGVPWWFFAPANVPYAGARLQSLDPGDVVPRAIRLRQVIGCVVHLSGSSPEPGLVRVGPGNHLLLGEPAGGHSDRVGALVELLQRAGFEAKASADIRTDIWYKLVGQHDDEPGVCAHRCDVRSDTRRSAGARLLPSCDAGSGGDRREDRLPDRAERRRPDGGHAQARRVQDIDAAGRGGGQVAARSMRW